ncbi:mannose-1-phosphate guanylyltransferase [Paenibacillus mendelii]|uniref:Mannose-1-phosphate guanylyltransferase n=1 Tax=Paenibacillus mendelii TaxID=206163 RepID=A0ABV6JIW1_9BACL|nr:sugar phosphate nucleotidyltransferase [Paenibacillus mendelii]MCQ6558782.1 sugar phosphate nucleotidyltransferase [Paenibacillus mendelii]
MNIVIMAGGKGTRFWPRSIASMPKQFLPFHSDRTLIQETAARFLNLVPGSRLYVAAPNCYQPLLAEQLPDMHPDQYIIEPEQKDTAACMALVASRFLEKGDDSPIVFVPSDQYVADEQPFLAAIEQAVAAAGAQDAIVTLGIEPDRPETGFGYLRTSPAPLDTMKETVEMPPGVLRVVHFLEKPNAERAAQLIREPGMYWNSGIFVWRPSTIARCLQRYQPLLWNGLQTHPRDAAAAYALMPALSIDYAVMEQVQTLYCIPVRCGWDDIGSWAALGRHLTPDSGGNIRHGDAIVLPEATGNTVFTDRQTLIIGVHDLIVVSTPHGLLVCPKAEEAKLKTWLAHIRSD